MARVKTLSAQDLSGDDRAFFEQAAAYGSFDSLLGAMANRPPIMRHVFGMLLELKREGVLPARYLELALVTVSKLNECTYCVSHHTPLSTVQGVSDEAAQNIVNYEHQPEFDEIDKLVIEYAKLVTLQAGQIRDEVFERLRHHFSDEQITELTWRAALCGAFNRFNDILQTQIEKDVPVIAANSPK